MTHLVLPAALLLALAVEPGKAPAGAVVPEAPPGANIGYASDYDDPPAGSAAELQLWRDGIEVTRRVALVRKDSTNLRAAILSTRLRERLEQARAGAGHEAGEHAAKLARRLEREWAENVDLFQRPWPVDPTRGCGYPHLNYDSAMRLPAGPARQAEVANTTPDLRTCVQRGGAAADKMANSNRRLGALRDEVEAALARGLGADDDHERGERREAAERKGGRG